MKNNDCVFCQIVKGLMPATKIYEDDDVLAFLDISQVTPGHALVIPKKHYDNFVSTPKDILSKVMSVTQRISQASLTMLGAKGINVLTNVNREAGQSVMHFHVHIIPRYISDRGFQITMLKNERLSELNLPVLASEIKKGL
ncbi:MAG: HIT family protein [Bacilli bacterium]|jgi:histidine triad (HIT) family protein|nr:HIT family protein [Bacilli bacterium]NLN80442.1 HIT family protein [Erysipelotrichia bacterium]